jgi:hypothetical protein
MEPRGLFLISSQSNLHTNYFERRRYQPFKFQEQKSEIFSVLEFVSSEKELSQLMR